MRVKSRSYKLTNNAFITLQGSLHLMCVHLWSKLTRFGSCRLNPHILFFRFSAFSLSFFYILPYVTICGNGADCVSIIQVHGWPISHRPFASLHIRGDLLVFHFSNHIYEMIWKWKLFHSKDINENFLTALTNNSNRNNKKKK